MMGSTFTSLRQQRGVSLSGLIAVMVVFGVVAVFGMKVFPSFIEFRAIKDGIAVAKATNGTVREMQISFDKNAEINGVTTIKGRDLIISKETGQTEISFAYQKWISLGGPVSLVIDYAGTTDPTGDVAKAKAPE